MLKLETPDIYNDLRARLIAAEFEPGEKLKPADMQDRYGCSANTIRDVLFRLASEGLADFKDQKGFRAPRLLLRKQHELTQMRIMLECEGACLSVQFGEIEWEAKLTAVHHKLLHIEKRIRSSDTPEEYLDLWLAAEEEFHQTLISACGSETLKAMHSLIYAQFRQQLITVDRTFTFIGENIAQHQAIVDACIEGDKDAVRAAIHAHLKRNLVPQHPEISKRHDAPKSSSI